MDVCIGRVCEFCIEVKNCVKELRVSQTVQ